MKVLLIIAIMATAYFIWHDHDSGTEPPLPTQSDPTATTIEIRRSENGRWLEVYRHGELHSEWQRSDGEVYDLLLKLVDGDAIWEGDEPKIIEPANVV